MKPSLRTRASKTKPAAMMASTEASATYWLEPVVANPTNPAARMAAVAESAPTTKCREEPKMANRVVGIRMVYSPVITGVPEIFV